MSIQSIIRWFEIAKPEPTNQDLLKQIAFHFEEVAEMLDALKCEHIAGQIKDFKNYLLGLSEYETRTAEWLDDIDRVALLDALCDQVVTATGVAVLAGMDFEPALAEVNRSNYTKFNADGTPYIKPDGKIGKNPETYQEPQLADYVSLTDRQQETKNES